LGLLLSSGAAPFVLKGADFRHLVPLFGPSFFLCKQASHPEQSEERDKVAQSLLTGLFFSLNINININLAPKTKRPQAAKPQ
jgi:hypothetical protein